MSLNPILLEMMARDRQRDLLAMARPHAVPVPVEKRSLGRRNPLWAAVRFGLARLLIGVGLRLKAGGGRPACPLCSRRGALPAAGLVAACDCPLRGDLSACPPLHSG